MNVDAMDRVSFGANGLEAVLPLLFLVALVVCAVFLLRWKISLARQTKMYERLATRYGGEVVSRLLFQPKAQFSYGRSTCNLKSTKKRSGEERTELTMLWPDPQLRFFIGTPDCQDAGLKKNASILNAKELGFKRDLVIQTNRLEAFNKVFSQSVCWKFDQLANQFGFGSVSITLKRGRLKISKASAIREFQQLDDLVRLCLELHDEMLLSTSDGVEFVDDERIQVLGEVKCPICSEEVEDRMVICVRCRTPHCKDCWEYNSHCATFACDETRFYETDHNRR